jgi:hypothetical protein
LRILIVGEEVQDGDQHKRDRLIQVQRAAQCQIRVNLARLAEVRLNERGMPAARPAHHRHVREPGRWTSRPCPGAAACAGSS